MRWRFGNFSLTHSPKPLTANRSVQWSDNSGTVELEHFYQSSPTSVVPLNRRTVMAPFTITSPYTFSTSSTGDIVGGTATYTITADGVNTPSFTGFTESTESSYYDGRVGIVNVIKFWYDGATRWYSVSQAVGQQPTWFNVALTFPTRTANISQTGQQYASTVNSQFNAQMTSAQVIPANKAGRLVVKMDDDMIIGFSTVSTTGVYTTLPYRAWVGSNGLGFYTDSTIGSASPVLSGTCPIANVFVRMIRSSAGVVTVEISSDGTTWELRRTFPLTSLADLYIAADISGLGAARQLDIISFDIEA